MPRHGWNEIIKNGNNFTTLMVFLPLEYSVLLYYAFKFEYEMRIWLLMSVYEKE